MVMSYTLVCGELHVFKFINTRNSGGLYYLHLTDIIIQILRVYIKYCT